MKKKTHWTKAESEQLDNRFVTAHYHLTFIGNLQPRASYLYPLMESTVFQDFETAMSCVIEDQAAEAANDKGSKARGKQSSKDK